jgi:predicted MFS family arabinose efflux permease
MVTRSKLSRPFIALWLATGTSALGTAVTDVAVPLLAVLTFHASPLEVAGLVAIEHISWLLIGLPAGVWVDRWPRRTVLMACDLIRAVLMVTIPVAAALGVITLVQLFCVAGLVGLLNVVFTIAQMAVVPALVPAESLSSANGRISATVTGADLSGRSMAGVLVQVLGAPVAVVVDAVSFFLSGILLSRLPARRPDENRPDRRFLREIGEGLQLTLRDSCFRTMTLTSAVSNLCAAGQYALTIVFLVEVLHVPSAGVGVLAAIGGLGGMAGAAAAGRLARLHGSGKAWRVGLTGAALCGLLVPATTPQWGLICFPLGNVGLSAGIAIAGVISGSARQALCPPALIGRMSATSRVLTWGVVPAGALLAGGLAAGIGIRGALWVFAAGFFAAPLLVKVSTLGNVDDLESVAITVAA